MSSDSLPVQVSNPTDPAFAGVIQTVEYEDGTQSIEREDYPDEEWEHIGHLCRA